MRKIINRIKQLYTTYKEVINYLIFGVLTTAVNFVVYFTFTKLLGVEEVTSNVVAWIISVLFAYTTNKTYVFESKTTNFNEIVKEMSSFFGCRLLSGLIDTALFALFVKALGFNDVIVKVILQVVVIILNYIFSKLIIFKKK